MSYVVYTDGACSGNPGPGGWAFIVTQDDEVIYKDCGGMDHTTNNQMEMTAALKAAQHFEVAEQFTIVTDSSYLKNGITSWIKNWKSKNWRTSKNKPVKNKDLWIPLDTLNQFHEIEWIWVKAHNGHKFNEMVDTLARSAVPLI